MNPKMNKMLAILQPLTEGMTVEINGDEYYMSDSVLYRIDTENHGLYVNESINSFANLCNTLSNNDIKEITIKFIKWKK